MGKHLNVQDCIPTSKSWDIQLNCGRFPDRTTGVGQMISSYLVDQSHLDDCAIHLLFSANRWEKRLVKFCIYLFFVFKTEVQHF